MLLYLVLVVFYNLLSQRNGGYIMFFLSTLKHKAKKEIYIVQIGATFLYFMPFACFPFVCLSFIVDVVSPQTEYFSSSFKTTTN
mmetsp:Transcript_10749/g.16940  ORF Transcript_10749/g.16940 Transcript_10749/m.16940 type:complete len:84 (-) Transcript_10749:26-277(-)